MVEHINQFVEQLVEQPSESPLTEEHKDFDSLDMRRVIGSLTEILEHANDLLEGVDALQEAERWDALPKDIEQFEYHRSMLRTMIASLD